MRITKQIVAITCTVLLLLCMPVSAHTDEELNEMSGEFLDIQNEIIALAQNIHDESEYIADDESLDTETRDIAEEVHQMAHRIDRSAHDIRHYIDDGEYNKAKAELENLKSFIIELNGPVHELDHDVPESHKQHADEIHHDLHDLQHVFQNFESLFYTYIGDHEYTEETPADSGDVPINKRLLDLGNEIKTIAQNIHDESEYIADDETLDQEIRDVAEEVHQLSHKIDRSAHNIRHYIDDGEVDKASNEMTNLRNFVISLSSLAHELDDITPESHKNHADEVHHDMHELQHKLDDFSQLFDEWVHMNPADDQEQTAREDIPEESQAESTPGFEAIFTIAGLLAVAFLTRKL